jgi:hypothetical protein
MGGAIVKQVDVVSIENFWRDANRRDLRRAGCNGRGSAATLFAEAESSVFR